MESVARLGPDPKRLSGPGQRLVEPALVLCVGRQRGEGEGRQALRSDHSSPLQVLLREGTSTLAVAKLFARPGQVEGGDPDPGLIAQRLEHAQALLEQWTSRRVVPAL